MFNQWRLKINRLLQNHKLLHILSCFLILFGLVLLPMHIRYGLWKGEIKSYARINVLFLLGMGILLYLKTKQREFTSLDKLMLFLWSFSGGLILCANYSLKTGRTVVTICSLLLPTAIILYRFHGDAFKQFMKCFLIFYDIFVVALIFIALFEKFSDNMMLKFFADCLTSGEYRIYLDGMAVDVWRAHTIWGHALLNAVFFNAFFIINDLYFISIQKKYPKLLFFMIALFGVLLCASKTAIVVLMAYFLISSWKNKKLMIACGAAVVIVFLLGGFNNLIQRFLTLPLTSGRVEMLTAYFKSGLYPLKFLVGYGTNTVYNTELYVYKAGFEFPIVMSALDHGILFAVLVYLGVYGYVSYLMLKNRKIQCWLGFSLIFAQMNTFNGLGLYNQDTFTWLCLFSALCLNCALYAEKNVPPKSLEEDTGKQANG